MRKFWRIQEKDETVQEQPYKRQRITEYKQQKITKIQDEIECEETIMQERKRFGRTRTKIMQYLREQYGNDTANRAMWRVNKRFKSKQVSL